VPYDRLSCNNIARADLGSLPSYLCRHLIQFLKMRSVTVLPLTSLVAWWSDLPTTNHEVPGLIPGSAMGISLAEEDPHGDHGLGSL
jgi:hypothetical protein